MASGTLEGRKVADGMAQVGETTTVEGGGQPGVSPVLQGGGTWGPDVWFAVLGAIRCDYEGGGEYPCGVPTTYYREAVNA